MPSDVMDKRNMPSFYRQQLPEDVRFPSEKQVGFWKTAPMPDHYGLEAMSLKRGKGVSSSTLENIPPSGGTFDCLQSVVRRNILHNFEHRTMVSENAANCWRAPDQNVASLSNLYGQPASLSVGAQKIGLNGSHYDNGFFSSSLSDIFSSKLRLSSNNVLTGQSANTTQPNIVEDEAFESLEEIEAQTIGDLLPDDDDLLSGAIHYLGNLGPSNRADAEDDLFCSVGGMEIESDDNCQKPSEYNYSGAANKLPRSEYPTRTLLVNNISSNIEVMELRAFFEQCGDIRSLYTSCRHQGFIMVSYYDIRAAQNATRMLQTKSVRGQKLDIQFCVSKDNPSEKDINEGVLLVTNLESCISNDDLIHIFGVYGEIKEISETPHQQHHKYIEFYDTRAAEAALVALNWRVVGSKRIKVELCGLRDKSFSLMQQSFPNFREEESSSQRQECFSQNISTECLVSSPYGLITHQENTSGDLYNGAIQGMQTAPEMQNSSSMESNFFEPSSCMPQKLSSPMVPMIQNDSNQSGNCELSHSLGQMNLGFQSMSTFSGFCHGLSSVIPFNSPSTMSDMAVDASFSFVHEKAPFSISEDGSSPLNGHEYIWNNSHSYGPGSAIWQNVSPFMNTIPPQTPQVNSLARGPSHMPNTVVPHQHVGSAPSVDPMIWDQRHSFIGDATSFNSNSLGTVGYSGGSPLQVAQIGVPSPKQRGNIFRRRNNMNTMCSSQDTPHDRNRSRRSDPSANQADSKKQFELDVDRIIKGEDVRTTLMIKNIPNKYSSKMLLATIDEQHKGTYDFIYLPIDFKNKCNVGYAFINMTDPQHIIPFYQAFNGKKWEKFNSEKVAYLAYARIQGKSALISHFQNSSLMNEDKRCRPIIFHSEGPNAGDQEPFPVGTNIRSRRSRTSTENLSRSPSDSSSGDESSGATGSSSGSVKN